ncbi:MAG: acyl-CoA ligase (AMP-forming), exosortase A system-associated [Gammaproteobacteria bacterium]|nr:acyl-CoA ligase (AMP-forming), exosortase A system-associated [Gammaproteobacteria bacterium]
MSTFFHQLITNTAQSLPHNIALVHKQQQLTYQHLASEVNRVAANLQQLDLNRFDRVATFLPKSIEAVTALFATSAATAVFVPINPVLKPQQVKHILNDCNVKVLITNSARAKQLQDIIEQSDQLIHIIVIDFNEKQLVNITKNIHLWSVLPTDELAISVDRTDSDIAAILYTSGSTGPAKGVVLSHRNIICGANSVASYLNNTSDDKILALLPLSFDYGLSQLTTAFSVGAQCVLMDYLLPNDVIKAISQHQITGLAAVPPLWAQLVKLNWPDEARQSLRYFTNSGGAMPLAVLNKLRDIFVQAAPYLMYGLTEAFRSSYLDPKFIDSHPDSIGKAIPNAQLLVITKEGKIAQDDEPGELVHRGPLVGLGYWNAPEKTAERYKVLSQQLPELCLNDIAVFSGDWVRRDSEGFLYFVGRQDDMIKSSGYRVSPSEVEEVLYMLDSIVEAAVIGVPHPELGQAIVVIYQAAQAGDDYQKKVVAHCRKELANYMQPLQYIPLSQMPHNANGKIDRPTLVKQYNPLFQEQS